MLEYEQVLTILEKLQQEECVEVLGVSKLISYNINKEPVEWKNLEMFSSLIGGFKKEENEIVSSTYVNTRESGNYVDEAFFDEMTFD